MAAAEGKTEDFEGKETSEDDECCKDGDDDDMAFDIIPDSTPEGLPRKVNPRPIGLGLDLTQAKQPNDQGSDQTREAQIDRRNNTVATILFELPDGSMVQNEFQMGQTVQVLKSYIASEVGIPMAQQSLYLETSTDMLLDPMTLLDYPEIDPMDEILIRVEGGNELFSHK